jgi:pimeloyl-ACP methyl ester carboxylesterase
MRPAVPVVSVLVVLLLAAVAVGAEDLPRRAALGVRFAPADAEGGGLRVEEVFPGTAASLGIRAGDRILALNGRPAAEFAAVLASLRAGDPVVVTLKREGKEVTVEGPAMERPRESVPDYQTVYGSVSLAGGSRMRTILTRPTGDGPFPALLFVQGLGPASMDFGPRLDHPYRRIVDAVTREGFVTLRVEKPGVGDSEGGPPEDVGFAEETAVFVAALRWLAEQEFVDRADLFLFGHSMGGVMAPLIGREVPYRGAIVYGTSGLTWAEYELENERRQAILGGQDYAEIDADLRKKTALFRDLYFSGATIEEVLERNPDAAGAFARGLQYGVKRPGFFREIANTNLAAAWKDFPGEVLVLWGEADFVSGPRDHEVIASIVNQARPGRAEYRPLPGMDHGFSRATSLAESFRNLREGRRAPMNEEILDVVRSWLATKRAR